MVAAFCTVWSRLSSRSTRSLRALIVVTAEKKSFRNCSIWLARSERCGTGSSGSARCMCRLSGFNKGVVAALASLCSSAKLGCGTSWRRLGWTGRVWVESASPYGPGPEGELENGCLGAWERCFGGTNNILARAGDSIGVVGAAIGADESLSAVTPVSVAAHPAEMGCEERWLENEKVIGMSRKCGNNQI